MTSKTTGNANETLNIKRLRPKMSHSASSNRLSVQQSLNPLSPTAEESQVDNKNVPGQMAALNSRDSPKRVHSSKGQALDSENIQRTSRSGTSESQRTPHRSLVRPFSDSDNGKISSENARSSREYHIELSAVNPRLSDEMVPERTSSKLSPRKSPRLTKSAEEFKGNSRIKEGGVSHESKDSARWLDEGRYRTGGMVSSALRRLVSSDRRQSTGSSSPISRASNPRHMSPENLSPSTLTPSKAGSRAVPSTRSLSHKKFGLETRAGEKQADNISGELIPSRNGTVAHRLDRVPLGIHSFEHEIPAESPPTQNVPVRTLEQYNKSENSSESDDSIQTTPKELFSRSKMSTGSQATEMVTPKAR